MNDTSGQNRTWHNTLSRWSSRHYLLILWVWLVSCWNTQISVKSEPSIGWRFCHTHIHIFFHTHTFIHMYIHTLHTFIVSLRGNFKLSKHDLPSCAGGADCSWSLLLYRGCWLDWAFPQLLVEAVAGSDSFLFEEALNISASLHSYSLNNPANNNHF